VARADTYITRKEDLLCSRFRHSITCPGALSTAGSVSATLRKSIEVLQLTSGILNL
jgi:hypothetical protein